MIINSSFQRKDVEIVAGNVEKNELRVKEIFVSGENCENATNVSPC